MCTLSENELFPVTFYSFDCCYYHYYFFLTDYDCNMSSLKLFLTIFVFAPGKFLFQYLQFSFNSHTIRTLKKDTTLFFLGKKLERNSVHLWKLKYSGLELDENFVTEDSEIQKFSEVEQFLLFIHFNMTSSMFLSRSEVNPL